MLSRNRAARARRFRLSVGAHERAGQWPRRQHQVAALAGGDVCVRSRKPLVLMGHRPDPWRHVCVCRRLPSRARGRARQWWHTTGGPWRARGPGDPGARGAPLASRAGGPTDAGGRAPTSAGARAANANGAHSASAPGGQAGRAAQTTSTTTPRATQPLENAYSACTKHSGHAVIRSLISISPQLSPIIVLLFR